MGPKVLSKVPRVKKKCDGVDFSLLDAPSVCASVFIMKAAVGFGLFTLGKEVSCAPVDTSSADLHVEESSGT